MTFEKVSLNIVERLAAERGPTSSKDYNSSQKETINCLITLANAWNSQLYPLISSLPGGSIFIPLDERTDEINPFINGFDGSQIFTDATATYVVDEGYYYQSDFGRPLTIKETFNKVNDTIFDLSNTLNGRISQVESNVALTYNQKQLIGIRIFAPSETSSPASLDGRCTLLELNEDQLALDIYGATTALRNDGVKTEFYSILAQLDSLQKIHSYSDATNEATHGTLQLHKHIYHQTPVGPLNNSNMNYYTVGNMKFTQGSLRVIVNGIELQNNVDYVEHQNREGFTISASYGPLEFGYDLSLANDKIWIHYEIENVVT